MENENYKENEIFKEITNFCKECSSHENCPEEECVLYRIENIVSNKKKYFVKIEETLSRVVEVEAKSKEEAIEMVEEKYNNEKIVLNAEDYINTNIDIYEN